LGVVPLAMSEWKPEIAPQAMVMNTNGNTLPANTGPVPSTKRVTGGMASGGSASTMPAASATTTPILTNALR
jgi:hypothetical protein